MITKTLARTGDFYARKRRDIAANKNFEIGGLSASKRMNEMGGGEGLRDVKKRRGGIRENEQCEKWKKDVAEKLSRRAAQISQEFLGELR